MWGFLIRHWIYWTHHIHFLWLQFTVALSPILNCSSYCCCYVTHTVCNSFGHRVLSVFFPTPVLWYRLPTVDIPLPGFQNCPHHSDSWLAVHLLISSFQLRCKQFFWSRLLIADLKIRLSIVNYFVWSCIQ
jgi:hypothetical protein